ncbi:PREDICTED: estradiol 17-beta-dehydrogenase 11-like [Nanorana parkeri]|uniref:estradiol 17-beta-dehydrogenase 11-like n=1 Tax=Nanorana parkeri TaxID=125878 RepID=UPI0008546AED|nr:PREDICTED: estradiol 17-beta-dehydrogenase 11-like [Nanorana parkeri]
MNIVVEILLLLLTILYSYLESFVKLFIPVKRKSVDGEIVLITGAGHGIGRNTAKEFAELQSVLVLWDINKKGIEETATECRKLGAKVYTYVVDCSKRQEITTAADKVKQDVGDVNILINNAGIIFCADVLTLGNDQIEKIFEVNILAHFWTTRAFLPEMMRKNHGHIVTIASSAGFVGVPYMVDYCSTKFAALGYHKALTAELAALQMTGIKTSCLCPVFVNTGFVKNSSTRFIPVLDPEDVAKKLVDGILTNKKLICIPPSVVFTTVLEVILPERALKALSEFNSIKFDAKVRSIDKDK